MAHLKRITNPEQSFEIDADDAADIRRLLKKLVEPRVFNFPRQVSPASDTRAVRHNALAQKIFTSRQVRSKIFSSGMFNEPGWEMLLALFVADMSEARMTVTRLADNVGAPLTTALRWIGYLESARLVAKVVCPTDRRKVFVSLTEKGRTLMSDYLDMVEDTLATPD